MEAKEAPSESPCCAVRLGNVTGSYQWDRPPVGATCRPAQVD